MDATSPPIIDRIDDLIGVVEDSTPDAKDDPGAAFTHPLLPGCTFPMDVEAVEVFAFLRDPLACEGALAHAARGRATAIYTEPPVANSEAGPRELVAVLMPASGYKAQD